MPGLLLPRSTSNPHPSLSSSSPPPSPSLASHNRGIASHSNRSSPPPDELSLSSTTSPFASTSKFFASKNQLISKRDRHERKRVEDEGIEIFCKEESDVECWLRMLALQREFHCYNSARLEAAVEALERGCSIEEVSIPSRLCLDLLNEELRAQMGQFIGVKAEV